MDLSHHTGTDLLRLYKDMMRELRERKITRSSNNPTADYAEYLVSRALDLERARRSTTGYDAEDGDGVRYEVKGRRLTAQNKSRQLSAIRGLEQHHFAFLAGILFEEDFSVLRGCLIPWRVVKQRAEYRAHVNGWILHLRDSVWDLKGVTDITGELVKAQQDDD